MMIADWILRITVLLAGAGFLSVCLRKASASLRHLVWAAGIVAALLVPIASITLPEWHVPLWPAAKAARADALFRVDAGAAPAAVPPAARRSVAAVPSAPAAPVSPRALLFLLWAAGATLMLVRIAATHISLARLRRRARPAREAVLRLERGLEASMGIRREVMVLETSRAMSPVTWGLSRPVILIPSRVAEDDPDRLKAVLIHELAHIARADFLWHTAGQLARALYWFHPLIWLAQREELRLREQASDDLVLAAGMRPSDYAGHLLVLTRTLTLPRLCESLAIARPSHLQRRVRAILDPAAMRRPARMAQVAAAMAGAAILALGVAVARPAVAQAGDFAALEQQADAQAAAYQFDEAAALLRRALELRKAEYGAASIEYARGLVKLGGLYRTWDRLNDASGFYTEAAELLEKRAGPNAPELFEALRFFALDAQARKDAASAEKFYERAIGIQRSNRIASADAALTLAELARVRLGNGDLAAAEELTGEALAAGPENSPERAAALAAQAEVLRRLARDGDAEQAERNAAAAQAAWTNSRLKAPRDVGPTGMPPFRVGNGVAPPRLTVKQEPQYSTEARINKLQGTVTLSIVIDRDGYAREPLVLRPLGLGLDQKAVEAIRQWRFQPGTKDGEPVSILATVEINFRLM